MQNLTHLAKGILVLAFSLLFVTSVQAQDPQTDQAKPDQVTPDQAKMDSTADKPVDKIKITQVGQGTKIIKEELHFTITPNVKLVHVYKKGDLIHVRVTNSGEPIKLTMFHESYYLGKNDNLEVDIPNVKDYFVSVVPASERDLINGVKSRGPERTFHVHDVTPQKNNTTGK